MNKSLRSLKTLSIKEQEVYKKKHPNNKGVFNLNKKVFSFAPKIIYF